MEIYCVLFIHSKKEPEILRKISYVYYLYHKQIKQTKHQMEFFYRLYNPSSTSKYPILARFVFAILYGNNIASKYSGICICTYENKLSSWVMK